MALRTRFLRDNQSRIIGTVVEGYSDGSQQIRNKHGQVVGKTVPRVGTKNMNNEIISRSSEVGFLFHVGFSEEE